jgi:hypothetical protein
LTARPIRSMRDEMRIKGNRVARGPSGEEGLDRVIYLSTVRSV